jgi:ankyrin repeat protein
MYAAHGDHPHSTNELLLCGADVTVVNLNGDSAFGIAIKRGSKLGTVQLSLSTLTHNIQNGLEYLPASVLSAE